LATSYHSPIANRLPRGDGPIVVGIGELLLDCFANEERLGGAPVNVAVHANALARRIGGQGIPATRVGADQRGDRAVRSLASHGVSNKYVQVDPQRATGVVDVATDSTGNATYAFAEDAAWDALELTPPWRELAESCHAVCFGTLAQRSEASRQALRAFLVSAHGAVRLLDVNLRQEFYSAEILESSLALATAVKLNEQELTIVCQLLGHDAADCHSTGATRTADTQARRLLEIYQFDWLALTRGSQGTMLFTQREHHQSEPVTNAPHANADSVGAGDACCAGLLLGSLVDWPAERTLWLANTLGAFVASQPGATPQLPAAILDMIPTHES